VCPDLETIQNEIIQKYRFQPVYHRFQTYGICEDCRENRPFQEIQKLDTERVFARDAIKMALSMQTRCLEFYKDAAKRSQDAGAREFFEQMVRQEEQHIAALDAKLEELTGEEQDLNRAPVFLHFNPSDLDAIIPKAGNSDGTEPPAMDAAGAMKLALVLNEGTTKYFREYAEKFAETHGKRILLEFAELEKTHGDFIRRQIGGT